MSRATWRDVPPFSLLSRRPPAAAAATVRIADSVTMLRRQGIDVLDFSAGRPAEHTPVFIREAAAARLLSGDTHQTMAQGTNEYRAACATKLGRENGIGADPETEIIATLGVKHGMLMTWLTTLAPGDEVLIEDPCFVSYAPVIELCGGVVRRVPLDIDRGGRWTAADLDEAVGPATRAIVFCSPHNPLGLVHTREDLEAIADVARRRALFVVADETYERLTWGGRRHISIATLDGMAERTVTLMGLTKAFAMGGWRVGFAHAAPEVITAMVTIQQHLNTCVSSIGQAGATAALRDEPRDEVRALWRDWEQRCLWAADQLARVPGVKCSPAEGGFYAWLDVRELTMNSERLARRLLDEHHVALVPGASFGPSAEGFLRFTCVRSWDDLRLGVSRLRTALPEVARG